MDINTNAYRIVKSLTEQHQGDKRAETARTAGKIGGKARARKLSPERRREIASKANRARWGRRTSGG